MTTPFSRHYSRLRPYLHRTLHILYPTAITLAAFVTARDSVVEITGVQGHSMTPTLSPTYFETGRKDQLLLARLHPQRGLRRGEIVSFWAPHRPDQVSVKRVVALPGDVVCVKAKRWRGERRVLVPFGHVWVEGDNWRATVDSNDFGPLPMALINGKAKYIVWPPSRWGPVPNPDEQFETYSKVIPTRVISQLPAEYRD